MKNNFKSILAILAIATFFSCNDEFLDKTPTEFINIDETTKSAALNDKVTAGTLNGIYSMMVNTGTGGTSSHEDFGQRGYDLMNDFLSGDIALSRNTYSRYADFANLLSTVDYSNNDNYMPWRYYYRIIRSANLVIEASGGNTVTPETDNLKFTLGQAKALRAYAYFYMSQMYAVEYNASLELLPIYKTPTEPTQPQSTMSDLYTFMIEDLNSAISLLSGFNRPTKTNINADVAKGLLAYVHASKGDDASNQLAKDLAEEVIASGYALTTYEETTGGFNDINTPSWIWGFDVTLANGLDLVSWWGQMDYFTYSYNSFGDYKSIDKGLYDMIPADDVRKTQFRDGNPGFGWWKFYNGARVFRGQRNIEDDYIYMRTEEMYLLSAEMSAKGAGTDADAQGRLAEILANRYEDASDYSDLISKTGDDLLNEIILQTRIELWGEGKSYLSMKRNKQMMTRGSNHTFKAGLSIPYSDERLTYEIPRAEIQNNPFIN